MKQNRIFYIIFIAFISLLPLHTTAQEVPANLVGFVATDSDINVRSRPNGAVIFSLPPNMSVSIVDESEDGAWLSVELLDGRTGWVSASLLRVVESAISADLVPITPDNAEQLVEITELASTLSTGITFSPDGRLLASYSWEGVVEIYDVRTKILITTLTDHVGVVTGAAFSPDGSELATSGFDASVKIWNTQTWGERTAFLGHTEAVMSVAYSADGTMLASVGRDALLNIWNVQTGERLHMIDVGSGQTDVVVFSPDGTTVATAGNYTNGGVQLWATATGEELWSQRMSGNLQLAFSPDGKTLVVSGNSSNLAMTGWDAETGVHTFSISSSTGGSGSSIKFNPSGSLMAAGDWSTGTFVVADVESETVLFTDSSQRGNRSVSIKLAFSPDGHLLATTDSDTAIRIWGVHGSQ
ncbi:MAG: SH3 domain-containing protein [Anaerolineae bacterium]|nr:SH3 domain-containing protein [Anaerolineae bacterium]